MSRKIELPKLNDDNTWDHEIQGQNLRFREAKARELADAMRQAASEGGVPFSSGVPSIQEQAHLLSSVVQRKNKEDQYEELPYAELMERGERFVRTVYERYILGLAALEVQVKKSSQPSKNETTPTQKSESSQTA